jgi:hypothetical protein
MEDGMSSTRETAKLPVSVRALMQRINRKLAEKNEVLKKTRPDRGEGVSQLRLDCGDYYIIDVDRNCLIQRDVDIEAIGRQLEVLMPWEQLAS